MTRITNRRAYGSRLHSSIKDGAVIFEWLCPNCVAPRYSTVTPQTRITTFFCGQCVATIRIEQLSPSEQRTLDELQTAAHVMGRLTRRSP